MKKLLLFSIFVISSCALAMEKPNHVTGLNNQMTSEDIQGVMNLVGLKGFNPEKQKVTIKLAQFINILNNAGIESSGLFGHRVTTPKLIKRREESPAVRKLSFYDDINVSSIAVVTPSIKKERQAAIAKTKATPRIVVISPRLKKLSEEVSNAFFSDEIEPMQNAQNRRRSLHTQLSNLEAGFQSTFFPVIDADQDNELDVNMSADL